MDKLTKYSCESPLEWHGCYDKDSKYSRYFTTESNAHPAKMSWGLADRIFKHLKKLRLLKSDSTIIDFMAGTGRTNIMATLHGHKSIAIELEPHFCKMIHDNKAQLEKVKMKDCDIEIIQADARNMSEVLKEGGVGVISPPYGIDAKFGGSIDWKKAGRPDRLKPSEGRHNVQGCNPRGYGDDPLNIGNLPDKPLVGVVSPPYQNAQTHPSLGSVNKDNWGKEGTDIVKRRNLEDQAQYSKNPSNIGNLPDKPLVGVVSPPYLESLSNGLREEDREKYEEWKRAGQSCGKKYSSRVDNIGNLPDKPLVGITSPPYEKTKSTDIDGIDWSKGKYRPERDRSSEESWGLTYSDNPENIGNKSSYLEAMFQVYSEAHRSGISPLVVVTKNPTRDGKLRRLDLDTAKLLQLAGYKIIDYHRAILFKERNQMTLDGKIKKIPKGRLSFFKRLSYQKGGKVARWEDVIFAVKDNGIIPLSEW